jgi:hypothetical protein
MVLPAFKDQSRFLCWETCVICDRDTEPAPHLCAILTHYPKLYARVREMAVDWLTTSLKLGRVLANFHRQNEKATSLMWARWLIDLTPFCVNAVI